MTDIDKKASNEVKQGAAGLDNCFQQAAAGFEQTEVGVKGWIVKLSAALGESSPPPMQACGTTINLIVSDWAADE